MSIACTVGPSDRVRGAASDGETMVVRIRGRSHEGDDSLDVVGNGELEHPRHESDGFGIARRRKHDVPDALDPGHGGYERRGILRSARQVELDGSAGVRLLDPAGAQPLTV